MNIYQRILKVMGDISYVQKENKKVNNQYTFVSHDAVVAKLRKSMVEHGIVFVPSVISHEIQEGSKGNRTVVEMQCGFYNAEKPDEFISVKSYGYGIDSQDKGIGKAVSYAVKYALLKVFMLETGDDPERDVNNNFEPKKNEVDLTTLKEMLSENCGDMSSTDKKTFLKGVLNLNSLQDIKTDMQLNDAIIKMKQYIKEQK